MAWELNYFKDERYIETIYTGIVEPLDLDAAFMGAYNMAKNYNTYKFLTDCTSLEGGHSVADLYHLISEHKDTMDRSYREALILPKMAASQTEVNFYETVCQNHGFKAKVFFNKEEALKWLLK